MAFGVCSGEEFSIDFWLLFVLYTLPKFCPLFSSQIVLLWNIFITKYFVLSYSIDVVSTLSHLHVVIVHAWWSRQLVDGVS